MDQIEVLNLSNDMHEMMDVDEFGGMGGNELEAGLASGSGNKNSAKKCKINITRSADLNGNYSNMSYNHTIHPKSNTSLGLYVNQNTGSNNNAGLPPNPNNNTEMSDMAVTTCVGSQPHPRDNNKNMTDLASTCKTGSRTNNCLTPQLSLDSEVIRHRKLSCTQSNKSYKMNQNNFIRTTKSINNDFDNFEQLDELIFTGLWMFFLREGTVFFWKYKNGVLSFIDMIMEMRHI